MVKKHISRLIDYLAAFMLFIICMSNSVNAESAPYPASDTIKGLQWASADTITRKASGSDNWPVTWGNDDNMYTAYGDGFGFQPRVPSKLSMGFAKVEGTAETFNGINIRSVNEQYGDGRGGKKSSGILMVDSVLYMWVRNADNNGNESELWYSNNHGEDWTDVGWNFSELGYPTFINFGMNYSGARDDFVYTVSHDNPSAYTPADGFVLLRCPKNGLTTKNNWQFFSGYDPQGDPTWSVNSSDRQLVFTHSGNCRRSGISYNSGIERYIWWQQIGSDGDSRYSGGFGVYDAPEPWGPWTTVFYTEDWDVGPGETGAFPTKWMSEDGQTMYLVFSGNDAFSVRKANLTLYHQTLAPTGLRIRRN